MNFNKRTPINGNETPALTYEGGVGYDKRVEDDWTNMIFSSMLEPRFYETENDQVDRYLELTNAMAAIYGYDFIGKVAKFARNEMGMRSISQLTAAYLNDKKFETKRRFFATFPHRADDVAETFAAVDALGQKRSHAIVRGFREYLEGLSEYQLAKYKMTGKNYNMYDCVNICHANSDAINALKNDTLAPADTWENEISNTDDKAASWKELVCENKLGYLALIRNLRNIGENVAQDMDGDVLVAKICDQLVNETAIRKSLVFPYQIYTAYKSIIEANCFASYLQRALIVDALQRAFLAACDNMPEMNGRNVVMLDVSSSMDCRMSSNSVVSIKQAGACFAAAIFFKNPDNTTIVKFGDKAKVFDSDAAKRGYVFEFIKGLCENDGCGYGTHILPAMRLADEQVNEEVSNLFLISDMQVCDSYYDWGNEAPRFFNQKEKSNSFKNAHVFSFDLGNYPRQCVSTREDVSYVTSLTPKVFDIIRLKQQGKSLVDYINENY